MKLAIMQPYFFPYIGYYQLLAAVDEFVVYDNIEFSKKGWVNRNRILVNGKDAYISLPLKSDSDYLDIVERSLADVWKSERKKLSNRISESYRKAPHYKSAFPVIEQCLAFADENLFRFIINSLTITKAYLQIQTPLIVSSEIHIDHSLRSEDKVLALCRARGADTYINPIGGLELYDKARFTHEGIALEFLKADNIQYSQLANQFIPFLSIIDVMMFNSVEEIRQYLNQYTIL
jgi:hypothetical protein